MASYKLTHADYSKNFASRLVFFSKVSNHSGILDKKYHGKIYYRRAVMLENKIVRFHGGRKTLATHSQTFVALFRPRRWVYGVSKFVDSVFPILKYVSVKLNSESVFFICTFRIM